MSVARPGPIYRFVSELASGGMGRIELVVRREGTFARAYARKRPLGDLALDVAVRDLLFEEARVAGLARNAHVVPVLDVGEDDEGAFLVMDFVDGVALDRVIERLGARLPLQCIAEIGRQIAEGLHAVHETIGVDGAPMEIVHRDLSPSNVLIGFDGVARVSDFGIARARDRAAISEPGALKGKKSYMAPEQLRAETVDRRTDLFALGVVLTEMIAGARLHGDVTPAERARRTLEEPPPDVGELRADVPPELVALAFELMARAPADRPRDARLVAGRLAAIRDQLRIEEGSIDLAELVRARFDDVLRDHERMLAEALRDQDPTVQMALPAHDATSVDQLASDLRPLSGELPLDAPTVIDALPTEPTTRPASTTGPRAPQALALVAVLGALALVSALVWWSTRPPDAVPSSARETPTPEARPTEPAPIEPAPIEPAPIEPVATGPAPREEAAQEVVEDEPPVPESGESPSSDPPTRRRRRTRATSSSPPVEEPRTRTTWSWE